MHAVYCMFSCSHCTSTISRDFILKFGGDLELKRLDLTWSGQVDLTVATLRSNVTLVYLLLN